MEEHNIKYYAGTKDNKDWGFYLEPDELLEGWIELTEAEHDELIRLNQEEGKIIKFEKNKKPVAIDYIPSQEELLKQELRKLQDYLQKTDYIAAKIAEGAATREDYQEQLLKRQKSRDRINEITAQLELQAS